MINNDSRSIILITMLFIRLIKLKRKPNKEAVEAMDKRIKEQKYGGKIHSVHWTLGRYDLVIYGEAPDEKAALRASFEAFDVGAIETLVAIPREEALKAVGLR